MLTKFIIDRTKWHRGKGTQNSRLLSPSSGKMCCLGFLCKAYGVTDEQMFDIAVPYKLSDTARQKLPKWLQDHNTPADLLIGVNDKCDIVGAEKEKQLTRLFALKGIEVTFVD